MRFIMSMMRIAKNIPQPKKPKNDKTVAMTETKKMRQPKYKTYLKTNFMTSNAMANKNKINKAKKSNKINSMTTMHLLIESLD